MQNDDTCISALPKDSQWIKKRFFCGSTGLTEQLKFQTVPAVSLICQGGIKINRGSASSQFGANRKPSSFKRIPVVTQLPSNAPPGTDVCAKSSTENTLRKKQHKLTLAVNSSSYFSGSICKTTAFFSSQRRQKMHLTKSLLDLQQSYLAQQHCPLNIYIYIFLLCLHKEHLCLHQGM